MERNFRIPMSRPDIGEEEKKALFEVLRTNWPSQGKITEEFESMLSDYLSSNAIAVNNGSSALMSALLAHGIKPHDKLIVPAFTFVATSSIPKILGADVIAADIDPETLNITAEQVENLVKQNDDVKFVIIVDVAGLPCDIDSFVELSKRYNFTLIEDAAQAFGSEYKNQKVGSFEHTTVFSFQITKQLTTIEGGCVSTSDKNIEKKIRKIKDYGRNTNEMYVHDIIGTNFRTTDLQSAIGIQQLKKVEEHISNRNRAATEFKKKIKRIEFQKVPDYSTRHSYLLFFAKTESKYYKDMYINHLVQHKIDARTSWKPIHMQPCNPELKMMKYENAEKVYNETFTIPIYNDMNSEEVDLIIQAINSIKKN